MGTRNKVRSHYLHVTFSTVFRLVPMILHKIPTIAFLITLKSAPEPY
jgi:hypothetical protein